MTGFFSQAQHTSRWRLRALVCCFALLPLTRANAHQNADPTEQIRRVVEEVRHASYPELRDVEIHLKLFTSTSDYFQARFTNRSFLGQRKLRYVLFVNRQLCAQPPSDLALRAILAHELGHLLFYQTRCRLRLLLLARLITPGYAASFERATDMQAIARGYGDGLKAYREWLYQQIPPHKLREKQRNYFSPAEIAAVQQRIQAQPALLKRWQQHPPRSLAEIER